MYLGQTFVLVIDALKVVLVKFYNSCTIIRFSIKRILFESCVKQKLKHCYHWRGCARCRSMENKLYYNTIKLYQ